MTTQRGAAPVETVFAVVLLMFLALAVVEVAFVLYARNVVIASAHEGARAGAELGRTLAEAETVAAETVARSAGGLFDDLAVEARSLSVNDRVLIRIRVAGDLRGLGPVPIPLRVTADASASRQLGEP